MPTLACPNPQHNALRRLLANLQLVNRRAVGMAVQQAYVRRTAASPWHFLGVTWTISLVFIRVCARLSLRSLRASLCRVPKGRWRRMNRVMGFAGCAAASYSLGRGYTRLSPCINSTGSPLNLPPHSGPSARLRLRLCRTPGRAGNPGCHACMNIWRAAVAQLAQGLAKIERWKGVIPSSPIQASESPRECTTPGRNGRGRFE